MGNTKMPINPTYHEVMNDKARKWEETRSERYKTYRKKWAENPRAFILEDAPLHLDIEPTNACNLKCPMCPRTVILANGKENFDICTMDLKNYKRLIDEASDLGVYSLKLNWLGEPLVHKDIVEMVRYAKEKNFEDVMFNTNAALLDEEMARNLIQAGLDKIFFSFDSPHKEKYEEIRVGASYEETLHNIKRFVELRDALGSSTPLTRVSMVLMEDNKDEYDTFVDMFKEIVDVVAYVEYREPVHHEIKEYNPDFACAQLWQRMFIAADGDVIVCCIDSEREYVAGNIFKDSISNIWKNEKYRHIREMHQKGAYNKIEMCAKCDLTTRKESGSV